MQAFIENVNQIIRDDKHEHSNSENRYYWCRYHGCGHCQIAIQSGRDVVLFDAKAGAAEQAQEKLAKTLNTLADKGKFSHEKAAEDLAHLSIAHQIEDLKDCDLIVEAIIENLEIKQN